MEIKNVPLKSLIRTVLILIIIIIFGSALMFTSVGEIVKKGLQPVVLAFSIAYILNYMVGFLRKRLNMDKRLAIAVTYIAFILIIVAVISSVIPRITATLTSLVAALSDFDINKVDIAGFNIDNPLVIEAKTYIDNSLASVIDQVSNFTATALNFLVSQVSTITSSIISFVVGAIISIYMLFDKEDLQARAMRLLYAFLPSIVADRVVYVGKKADMIFRSFVIGKFLDSFIIGVICYFILIVFGFNYALLIAFIVGITNMIPYFGPLLGMIPASIITLINSPSEPQMALWMLLIIFILQQLDGFVIGPWILGDTVGVSAFWIIVAVTVGGSTFGILGMFLGVPTLVLIKTLLEESVENKLDEKSMESFYKDQLSKPKKKTIKDLKLKK